MCKYHENFKIVLEALKRETQVHVPTEFREFLDSITCDQNKDECLLRECEQCASKCQDLYNFNDYDENKQVKWLQLTKKMDMLKRCVLKELSMT